MAIDRSKYKSTVVATIQQRDEEVTSMNDGQSADYIKIKPGANHFRIYPAHPEKGGTLFAEAKVVHWLTVETEERDKDGNIMRDEKGKPKMTRKSKPIFNSKVHGGTQKDVIEEYIAFANKVAKETYSKEEEQKKFLQPIYGTYNKANPKANVNGITSKPTWVMYVDKLNVDETGKVISKQFGRLEIGKAVKQRLNALAASESASEPLGTDPFTDVEEGRAIIITYNDKAERPQDYYTTEFYAPLIKGGAGRITLYPLSDADLEAFDKVKPLSEMFLNSYSRKDFETALKALKILDDECGLGIFGYEQFLDTVEEIDAYYPEVEEKAEEVSGDEFDQMERAELIKFARDNKTGIVIRPALTEDAIRNTLRDWKASQSVTAAVEGEGEGEVDENPVPEQPVKATTSTADRLAAIRAKTKKQ